MPARPNLLVVARWPLGGIRTYMKYVYKYLPGRFAVTILAASTIEDDALKKDAGALGAALLLPGPGEERDALFMRVFRELLRKRYSLIQSQGFLSGVHAGCANFFFRVPHVLTVHGILERRYLEGNLAAVRRFLLARILKGIDVIHAVSDDILNHVLREIPGLERSRSAKVVIRNGIDADLFAGSGHAYDHFRRETGIRDDQFLIGFLGRFMPEKGFMYLIDAAAIVERKAAGRDFRVLAVGSGAYIDRYKKVVRDRGMERRFVFLPFRDDVAAVYRAVDVVVMPSVWEAFPLQPMEAMCAGAPVIASDCMGLRETVRGTPAAVFESGNAAALAEAICGFMANPRKELFEAFRPVALERFDARKSAGQLAAVFMELIQHRGQSLFYDFVRK